MFTKEVSNKIVFFSKSGEILIWDERDQGGYMIDNQGEWAKIQGPQWFRRNLWKNCSKASFFRSHFQCARQPSKRFPSHHAHTIAAPRILPPQTMKYPLLSDS